MVLQPGTGFERITKVTQGLVLGICLLSGVSTAMAECPEILQYSHRALASSKEVNFCEAYAGKVLLVVNTASRCGFTGQFEDLETLYQRHKDQGLVVLGFPSDDFNQEHADEDETANVCQLNYGVTFPMFATSSVRGESANVLFTKLNAATKPPSWNFNKYLIGRNGEVLEHFGSMTKPTSDKLEAAVVRALEAPSQG